MADYQPITKEVHLARGTCCGMCCFYCPYPIGDTSCGTSVPSVRTHEPDPQIVAALQSGQTVTIDSDRYSLIPEVVLLDRVTVRYKTYNAAERPTGRIFCKI